jgi:hypothetical protein
MLLNFQGGLKDLATNPKIPRSVQNFPKNLFFNKQHVKPEILLIMLVSKVLQPI